MYYALGTSATNN